MVYPSAGIPNSTGSAWGTSYGTSGANSVVLRDANQNIVANSISETYSNVAAAGTTTVLTVASGPNYVVTGSGGQTYQLPDATTLPNGIDYTFNNNQSSGTIVVKNNSGTTVATVQSGGYVAVILLSNATAAGSWDTHNFAPSNVSWSTNTFDYAGSITSATWNGATVAVNRGGTGSTTAQGAINTLAGAVTSGSYLRGNGTNVVMSAIQAADVPTLNQNTTGTAANITATSNATLTTLSALSLPYSQLSGTVPTWNQNTTGTAANVTGTVSTANGGTGLTSFTANGVVYASSTSALATGSNLTWDGSILTASNASGTNLVLNSTGNTPFLTFNQSSLSKFYIGASAAVGGGGTGYYDLYGVAGIGQRFFTNDTERMRILSNGNIGIGTSSPSALLHVAGTGDTTSKFTATTGASVNRFTNNSADFYVGLENSAGTYFSSPAFSANIYSTGAYPMLFWTNGTERMRIDSSGNLGLHNNLQFINSSNVMYGQIAYNQGNDSMSFTTLQAERMRITSTGAISVGSSGTATGTSGQVLTSQGSGSAPIWAAAGGGGGITFSVKTANYTASAGQGILANTSAGAFTVTLPATPSVGAQIIIADSGNAWATNNLTVGRNGSTIAGFAQDLTCDLNGSSIQLVYDGSTWNVYAQVGGQGVGTPLATPTLSAPASSNEGTTITVSISNYNSSYAYIISVTGGSYTQSGATINWTLPLVSSTTIHYINAQAAYSGAASTLGTANVTVNDIPLPGDTAISITDFSTSTMNDGWTL
jgi:hypothetical protein